MSVSMKIQAVRLAGLLLLLLLVGWALVGNVVPLAFAVSVGLITCALWWVITLVARLLPDQPRDSRYL